ncbi:MAG: DUF2147 domain-containing protein, partial [Hyphomicrobium sp.]
MRVAPATRYCLGALSAAVSAIVTVTSANAGSSPAQGPVGVWMDHTGRGAVEIKSCGGALCGHVVWVKSSADAKGCGRQIIGDARPAGSQTHQGWIYSPEDKKRYNVELTPQSGDRLRVVGYAGIKLFSRTMVWKRAGDDLVRCGTESAAKTTTPVTKTAAIVEPKPEVKPEVRAEAKPAATAVQVAPAPKSAVPKPVVPGGVTTATEVPPKPLAVPATEPASAQAEAEGGPEGGAEGGHNAAAEADEDSNQDGASANTSAGGLDLGTLDLKSLDLKSLKLDKVLKREGNGKCKLNLPWL